MKIVGTKVTGGSRSQLHGGRASHGRLRPPIHGKSDRNRRGQYKENQVMMILHQYLRPLPGHSLPGLLEASNRQMMIIPPSVSGMVLSLTAVPPGLFRVHGRHVTLGLLSPSGGIPVTLRSETIKNTDVF